MEIRVDRHIHDRGQAAVERALQRGKEGRRLLDALAVAFLEGSIGGAPVIGPDRQPLGMVSKTDLLREIRSGSRATTF